MESNSIDGHLENNGNHAHFDGPLKVIIDTDPGIGAPSCPFLDAFSIANDLQRWHGDDRCNCEVNFVLIFPGGKPRVADFIHGSDGLGNIFLPPPLGKKIEKTASEFLVEKVSQYPGDVCILALGPLTNLALIPQSVISDADLSELRNSKGKHSQILCDMCKFYRDWNVNSNGVYGRSTLLTPHNSFYSR
ncbi:hypothetical protein GW17_00048321 [Ensete ventricosum]|nr:hypothetical protein GW17_00048321 [Ensete ventricosum]